MIHYEKKFMTSSIIGSYEKHNMEEFQAMQGHRNAWSDGPVN